MRNAGSALVDAPGLSEARIEIDKLNSFHGKMWGGVRRLGRGAAKMGAGTGSGRFPRGQRRSMDGNS
ncbi:hypothetical protein GCM10011324_35900 [Allosediminivita pacifica]|nr:hypothetical protein GCM10011324_35900 [Allosediminivita pacifica]